MGDAKAFGIIKQAVDDPIFLERLARDMEGVLTEHGFSEQRERDEVTRVLAALGFFRTDGVPASTYHAQYESTLQTADSFKAGLRDTVSQIERGFRTTMGMYTVAFYLGVAFIVAAVVMAFVKEKALLPIVFGSLGMADVIAYFITKPPQDLQFSRARLAQLQAAFFNWFIDYTNWNGVLMAWTQEGKADLQAVKAVSTILMEHTEKTMDLIDKYCGTPRILDHKATERKATDKLGAER
jgi:hypothetical protein